MGALYLHGVGTAGLCCQLPERQPVQNAGQKKKRNQKIKKIYVTQNQLPSNPPPTMLLDLTSFLSSRSSKVVCFARPSVVEARLKSPASPNTYDIHLTDLLPFLSHHAESGRSVCRCRSHSHSQRRKHESHDAQFDTRNRRLNRAIATLIHERHRSFDLHTLDLTI